MFALNMKLVQAFYLMFINSLGISDVLGEVIEGFAQKTFMVSIPVHDPSAPISIITKVEVENNDDDIVNQAAETENEEDRNSVHFSVSHHGYLNTWSLDLAPGQSEGSISKTLCPGMGKTSVLFDYSGPDAIPPRENYSEIIYIVAYSRTRNRLNVDIKAERNQHFYLFSNSSITFNVNKHSSQVYQYNFKPEESAVLVRKDPFLTSQKFMILLNFSVFFIREKINFD